MASRGELVLAIDVGNTKTDFGLFRGEELAARWSVTTPVLMTMDEAHLALLGFFSVRGIDGATGEVREAIVSSVVPPLTDVWVGAARAVCGSRPLVVGPGLKTGLKMSCHDPAEVGADRIADLVAAKEAYGAPLVVVDLGTTTNFEVLDAAGAFAGGIIAPGLRLSVAALSSAAARLSEIEVRAPERIIGRSTREAMQSGAVMGEVARIDGLIDLVWRELGCRTPVIISGTDAPALAPLLSHAAHVDDSLTLRGLMLLQRMNRRKESR